MKKKITLSILAILVLTAGFFAWKFFGSTLSAEEGKYLYIKTGSSFRDVQNELTKNKFIHGTVWFRVVAKMAGYKNVKPGRYKITKGLSLVKLVRMLKNGQQTPVSFVITKIRTKEGLANKTGASFECDSLQMISYIDNLDSLKIYDLDTNTVMAAVLPLTYEIKWNTTPGKIFQQFYTAYKNFWTEERKQKAQRLNLTPTQVSTLASIIDEETNSPDDRPKIASVYLNRIAKGMPLQADPTIKFALKDFGIRRILNGHLQIASPYNTYLNKGLPPGPICTPALETIDAVLDSPKTDYLYFVASSKFDGSSVFTTNLTDHSKYAREYQQELTRRMDSVKKLSPK